MSVSSVTPDQGSGWASQRSSIRQASQDFDQLFKSLQNGNLSAAQQAYASFQQVQAGLASSSATTASGTAPATNPVLADWSAVGQALQSGSLSAAQGALGQLEQDAQVLLQSRLRQQAQNAQSVYALMQNTLGSAATASAGANAASGQAATGSVRDDLSALSQALQSGDTAGARKLLAQLEQDLQASNQANQTFGRHHHHHHLDGVASVNGPSTSAGTSTSSSVVTTSATSTTTQTSSSGASATT